MNEFMEQELDRQEVEDLKEAVFQNFLSTIRAENKSAAEYVNEYVAEDGFTGVLSGLQRHGIKDKLDLYRKLSLALGED